MTELAMAKFALIGVTSNLLEVRKALYIWLGTIENLPEGYNHPVFTRYKELLAQRQFLRDKIKELTEQLSQSSE